MPAVTTTTTTSTENTDVFPSILNTLLEDKPLSHYSEGTLLRYMDYLAVHTDFRALSKLDFNKLTTIHAKFLSFYCIENLHLNNNQTSPSYSQFLKFSEALQNKEEYFYLPPNHQIHITTDCETSLHNNTQRPISLNTKISAAVGHGALAGSANAIAAIAIETAKSKNYSETQLKLLKTGLLLFNSLAIASYASISVYLENSQESEAAPVEKMAQSFAWSLASTTSLYALTHGINYFAKPLENKLIKGFLNALPLAGNMGLLIQSGNNLAETAAMMGVNLSSGSAVSAAIQTGWHFFSKRGNSIPKTDHALELSINQNEIENTTPAMAETVFAIDENSNNTRTSHLYEWVNNTRAEETGYLCMNKGTQLDDNGYLQPKSPIPVTSSLTHTQSTFTLGDHGYSRPKAPIPVTSSVTHTQSTFTLGNHGYSRPKPPVLVTRSTAALTSQPEIIANEIDANKESVQEKHDLLNNTQTVSPNTPSTSSKPALPPRNLRFLSSGGIYVTSPKDVEENVSQSSADRFKKSSLRN